MDDVKRRERMKLPKVTVLGQGSRVYTRIVSKEKLAQVYGEPEDQLTVAGCWDVTEGTIWIGDHLTPRQQWDCWWHEMLHAVHDLALGWKGGL